MPSSGSTSSSRRKSETPSFVCDVPLRTSRKDEHELGIRLKMARQVYNACLGEALRRASLLKERKAYVKAIKLPKSKERLEAFKVLRASVGFTDAGVQHYAVLLRKNVFKARLDVHVTQKLASRAFTAANDWVIGKHGRPRFKGFRQLDSIEGKSNDAGLRWKDNHIEWFGLKIPARMGQPDPVVEHAVSCRIKYVRLVRRKLKHKDRFFAQLVCEGVPYRKPEHKVESGVVGLDIGPSTIAVVGKDTAFLEPFCGEIVRNHAGIRRVQRKSDRQRRANNPDNYLPDGRVKPGRKKTWVKSTRQEGVEAELAELLRVEAEFRKSLHGRLANRILAIGSTIKTEKLSYRAFQKQYGKSVSVRAPGMFVSMLRRKAESAGGGVIEFQTRTTKLSQTCHNCLKIEKKPLSMRTHACTCGITMQRDLYSAFMARCVGEDGLLHAGLAQQRWSGAEPLLRTAWSEAFQPANGRIRPSSFGAMPRSQSGSSAEERTAQPEAGDAVACGLLHSESPGEATAVPFRTPWL